ncbi:MAG: TetR/AcrR family transcriptional regulator [Actinomycetales bacterium]
MSSTTRSGPVRSEAARMAVLEATARLFVAHGYDDLTISGIAAEAGVGKQTIYRWWPSKSAVVAECLVEGLLIPADLTLPDTGDVRADLTGWVQTIFDSLFDSGTEGLLRSLIAAGTESDDVAVRIRDSLSGEEGPTGGKSMVRRLEESVGQAPNLYPGAPFDEIGEALVGVIMLRALSRQPPAGGDAARLVDAILGTRTPQE